MPRIRYWTARTGLVVREQEDAPPTIRILRPPPRYSAHFTEQDEPPRTQMRQHYIEKRRMHPPPYPPIYDYF